MYDYMGRRVAKQVRVWDPAGGGGAGAWSDDPADGAYVRKFVWAGWLMLMELDSSGGTGPGGTGVSPVRSYTWGLDLAGQNGSVNSLEAAGGIGGLLALRDTNGTPTVETDDLQYVYLYDANGNVGQLVDWTAKMALNPVYAWAGSRLVARYEYDPYGTVIGPDTDADGDWTDDAGPYATANAVRFSTKYFDDETGLGYWGYRYHSPGLGRFIGRDPVGEPGANVIARQASRTARSFIPRDALGIQTTHPYRYVRNSPINSYDLLGLLDPLEFWDDWTEEQRKKWFDKFRARYGDLITSNSKRYCVPYELLAAIIANEQIDYSWPEALAEEFGFGESVGPAQITLETASRAGCLPLDTDIDYILGYNSEWRAGINEGHTQTPRQYLQSREGNIQVAACLVSKYLPKLCSEAKAGKISKSFSMVIADSCCIQKFCCSLDGKDCDTIAGMDVPACVLQAMAAIWNNGPAITQVDDVGNKCPNGTAHGSACGNLDGHLLP